MDFLYEGQKQAIRNLHNGCILCGGVGSGKSRTALSYFFIQNGGEIGKTKITKKMKNPLDLYIITPAMKRDMLEWDKELAVFSMYRSDSKVIDESHRIYHNKVVVDSWNNIKRYADITGAFFIFDEDRVTGEGAWAKTFVKIARGGNKWIILSATPGDTWKDYWAVFVANGFYKNKTEFFRVHVEYEPFAKYPKIRRYNNLKVLDYFRNQILVDIPMEREQVRHDSTIVCEYDIAKYKNAIRTRLDPYKNEPIENAASLCYVLRRICNEDKSRGRTVLQIMQVRKRAIIFYNFDYELNILKLLDYPPNTIIAEWNGHKHQEVPKSERFVYLVNYGSGSEAWNCITTDTMIFYSQNYSYRITEQAHGRIDRANTPFKDLYFYTLRSRSGIDLAIKKALKNKEEFNERKFVGGTRFL